MGRRPLLAVFAFLALGITARAEEPKVFFGNLHSHTSYSDGSGTPEQAYKHARDVARLDFIAITEHNHSAAEDGAQDRADGLLIGRDPTLYEGPGDHSLVAAAKRFTENGKFVALYGQEFSSISKGNHVNVFDVPRVIKDAEVPNGRFDKLVTWLADPQNKDSTGEAAILQFNHPNLTRQRDPQRRFEYGMDDFASRAQWVEKLGKHACLLELLNGPAMVKEGGHRSNEVAEDEFRRYLSLGFHVAPTGDQDNHYFTWGTATDTRTAVLAESLTKENILKAMRARHVYATEDKNLRLIFKVNGKLCGDVLPPPQLNSQLKIEYRIEDADEPNASYRIDVFTGKVGGDPATVLNSVDDEGNTPAANGGWKTFEDVTYTGGSQYVYFRVTQGENENADRSWTAPVWLQAGPTTAPADDDELLVDEAKLVASKRSGVYHVSIECRGAQAINAGNLIRGAAAKENRRLHQGCPQR